jgi:hypothetical protein
MFEVKPQLFWEDGPTFLFVQITKSFSNRFPLALDLTEDSSEEIVVF